MYTGKTPDELANCASVEKEREIVAIPLRKKGLRMLEIAQKLGVLNNFWIHNGREVLGTYRGWLHTQVLYPYKEGIFERVSELTDSTARIISNWTSNSRLITSQNGG
jgi:hypothetical protein